MSLPPSTIGPPRASATWWHSPQRVWLRRAIFQVHLWVGVVLAVYAVVIGLSGAVLVFKDRVDAHELGKYKVSHAKLGETLNTLLLRVSADRPGWRVSGLSLETRDASPITAMLYRRDAVPDGNYRAVIFDPGNGHVFSDRMRFDGVLGWFSRLHFDLLLGRKGLIASGWMAIGLLLLAVTGLIVWWPGVRRWVTALSLRRHRVHGRSAMNWKRLNWDMHSVVGFWMCVPLLAVTLTGVYFAFPKPVRNVVVLATGGNIAQADRQEDGPTRKPVSSDAPLLNIDQVLLYARNSLPANAPPAYVSVPAKPGAPWYVTGYYRDALPFSRLVSVTLDPRTGDVLKRNDTTKHMLSLQIVQHVFTVHFGSFGGNGTAGMLVRCVWVLVGVAPAVLAITGLIMFWNRKLSKLIFKSNSL